MANRPLISVIVIAHERKEFILDAIRSLKDQSAPKESYDKPWTCININCI